MAALLVAFPQFPTFTHCAWAGGWSLGAADGFVRGGAGKIAGFWGWWGDLASKGWKLRGWLPGEGPHFGGMSRGCRENFPPEKHPFIWGFIVTRGRAGR